MPSRDRRRPRRHRVPRLMGAYRQGEGRGGRTARWFELIGDWIAEAWPTRRRPFSSPAAAHFWFEWRSSGAVLPALVGGVFIVAIGPLSWIWRGDAGDTLRLLIGALATPIVLAIPVGMAASKPTFWSEDLSVPAFVAVCPFSADAMVATKVKVAAVSAVLAWLVLLAFVTVWLLLWGNLDGASRIDNQLSAFYGRSAAVMCGILIVTSAMFLTWRCLVSRLWAGLSGNRALFMASVVSVPVVALVALLVDARRLPGWLLEDPLRMSAAAWILSIAVAAKYSLAAWSWRRVGARYVRRYLLVWCAGTVCFVIVSVLFWRIVRTWVARDIYQLPSIVILPALLAMPLARVGLAPSSLARTGTDESLPGRAPPATRSPIAAATDGSEQPAPDRQQQRPDRDAARHLFHHH